MGPQGEWGREHGEGKGNQIGGRVGAWAGKGVWVMSYTKLKEAVFEFEGQKLKALSFNQTAEDGDWWWQPKGDAFAAVGCRGWPHMGCSFWVRQAWWVVLVMVYCPSKLFKNCMLWWFGVGGSLPMCSLPPY